MPVLANDALRKQEDVIADKIQRCLRSDEGKLLVERLLELHHQYSTQLKSNRELVDIHRNQGKIEAIEVILRMREEKV